MPKGIYTRTLDQIKRFAKLANNRKGTHQTIEHIKKRIVTNENHPSWKGDKVGYTSLHAWVRRHKPQVYLCENCNLKPSYDLANISGLYKRDFSDWEWLCRKCHMVEDGRLDKLHKNRVSKKNKTKLGGE